jgi:double-stranded uracil-DNA glycosylase
MRRSLWQVEKEYAIVSEKVFSLDPVVGESPQCLLLGSMPGEQSLAAREYYAHPRNLFWRILGELIGARRDLPYEGRTAMLQVHGIALWDVAHSCFRAGSADSSIQSAEPNDFGRFFQEHPTIEEIFFNGSQAKQLFMRLVWPALKAEASRLRCSPLPSTSPANARMPFSEKLRAWSVLCACGSTTSPGGPS